MAELWKNQILKEWKYKPKPCKKCGSFDRNLHEECPHCKKAKDIRRHETNPEGDFKRRLERMYGISLEKYREIFDSQGGCCAICGRHQSELKQRLSVDHDHENGQIRGLLCHACNQMLGMAKDDTNVLNNAILYLEKFQKIGEQQNSPLQMNNFAVTQSKSAGS